MTNLHNSDQEQWKDITGYEGYYQVSSFGNIKSLPRASGNKRGHRSFPGTILKPNILRNGYCLVTLSINGVPSWKNVHRLVATYFVPNPDNKPEVNHINAIKTDNRYWNLEWCTASENKLHAYRMGLATPNKLILENKTRLGRFSYRSKRVAQYSLDNELIKIWECQSEAAQELGLGKNANNCISNSVTGRAGTAYGFIWRNVEDN